MARVSIDGEKCQGHGRCALIAPEVFDVDDLGVGVVLVDSVSGDDRDDAEEAALSCPESAIALSY